MAYQKVISPKVYVVTSASAANLQTAVDTQVNTLIKQYVNPVRSGSSATAGPVQNDSIVIDPVIPIIDTNDVVTYMCSIRWMEFYTPS